MVGITTAEQTVLAVGTTLGVIVHDRRAVAVAALARISGCTLRFDWRHEAVRHLVRLAAWVALYVAANQLAYVVIIVLNNRFRGRAPDLHDRLHGVPAAPRDLRRLDLHRAAAGHERAVVDRASRRRANARLAWAARHRRASIIPAAIGLLVLAEPISRLLFEHGEAVPRDSVAIARTLQGFAVGLLFFSTFQLLTRTFYAMQDTRTPALVNVVAAAVNIGARPSPTSSDRSSWASVGWRSLTRRRTSVGAGVLLLLLRRRLGPIDGARIARTVAKSIIAAVASAFAALGVIEAWSVPRERQCARAGSTGGRRHHRGGAGVPGLGTYPASRRGR